MIGAQAYYRNCGFVDFIEEKETKVMMIFRIARDTGIATIKRVWKAYFCTAAIGGGMIGTIVAADAVWRSF